MNNNSNPHLVKLTPLKRFRLAVEFSDGRRGIATLLEEDMRGKNARLSDPDYFAQAFVHEGDVMWPGGEQGRAEALYSDARFRPEPLRVRDLINLLQAFPPDARVIVAGYEGGFDDVTGAELRPVIIDGGYRMHEIWGGALYSPREDGLEGEHSEATLDDLADPDYAELVYLTSNRVR
ncbi:DUF2442 domain-containing protein [Paraburkholderia dinghuensis]|nr:DUF2442 domain-containing protein [Paraburkholderia dinghuensis]